MYVCMYMFICMYVCMCTYVCMYICMYTQRFKACKCPVMYTTFNKFADIRTGREEAVHVSNHNYTYIHT